MNPPVSAPHARSDGGVGGVGGGVAPAAGVDGAEIPGPALFARYAYPPNALGYCGPGDPASVLQAGTAGQLAEGIDELAHLASRFDGAWPYLQLIAGCHGIADPLDRRVVEAYWIGNELILGVAPTDLAASLGGRFERRAGRRFAPMVSAALAGGIAQHSFHVFAVYPWLGLLRAGMEGPPLVVLDRCRIRWGTVVAVMGDRVAVSGRPLTFTGSRLVLGEPRVEEACWRQNGAGFVDRLGPGDVVSLHWDWVCDRLSPQALRWLMVCTRRNLDVANALPEPGPAVVCGT